MRPTIAQIRELHRRNKTYPDVLTDVPQEEWPQIPEWIATGSVVVRVKRSKRFLAMEWRETNDAVRISVMRTEYGPDRLPLEGIGWDDLQLIKAQMNYAHLCAVEIYPPESEVVNVANMRHIWLCNLPGFMWKRGSGSAG